MVGQNGTQTATTPTPTIKFLVANRNVPNIKKFSFYKFHAPAR